MDATFVFVFLIELIARVFLDRWHVLRDVAFWFDAFLVTAGLVDMYLIMPLIDTGLGGAEASGPYRPHVLQAPRTSLTHFNTKF